MANQIGRDEFVKNVIVLLKETFESSGDKPFSIYLDGKVGVFETLEKLSAEQASRETNGNTIAAHAEHLRFYLVVLKNYMSGNREKVDWAESWKMKTVNEVEWTDFQENLRQTYLETKDYLKSIRDWNEEQIGGAIAIIAHTAYHFAAIRQILKAIK
ncbi:MAG: hypothetical protein M3209_03125 [Acidobacteriota bacterium]|nr:hypothetical protein [Acidobacteriota bacterium]